jgi:hypothetical protein
LHEILTANATQATNMDCPCQISLRDAGNKKDPQQDVYLKRCISLSSDMNQGGQESSLLGLCRPRPIYSPAHSPPPELSKTKRDDKNARFDHLAQQLPPNKPQAAFPEQIHVYTQLQTQLFPQMKF